MSLPSGFAAITVEHCEKLEAENEKLRAALIIARQWMPVHPIPNTGAVEDCAVVDAALGKDGHG